MSKDLNILFFKTRDEFRDWLRNNHDSCSEIWLGRYKKHTNRQGISYDESVEEAICYGWIDSVIRRLDSECYMQKFTPRKDFKHWSPSNKIRVIQLIRNGKMTKYGLNKIDYYLKHGKINWDEDQIRAEKAEPLVVPDFILEKLAKNQPALINFFMLTESQKRLYVRWITKAKRQETIDKRIEESIERLKLGKRLGMP